MDINNKLITSEQEEGKQEKKPGENVLEGHTILLKVNYMLTTQLHKGPQIQKVISCG